MSMMFVTSKILSFATQPLAWVAAALVLGLLLQPYRRAWGLAMSWLALGILLLQGWQPLPEALIRHLESQAPRLASDAQLARYAGVIVLGGALEPAYVWADHGQPALNEAAERMTTPVALLKRHAHLKLLFTGGEGELFGTGLSEAQRARIFFDAMGVPAHRVVYESASKTTYENATLSAKLAGIDPAQPWLLLTSAAHMPRAMATFRHAGWQVTPYPVDFRTGKTTPWTQYSLERGAKQWQIGLHEWIGLWAYRLTGRATNTKPG